MTCLTPLISKIIINSILLSNVATVHAYSIEDFEQALPYFTPGATTEEEKEKEEQPQRPRATVPKKTNQITTIKISTQSGKTIARAQLVKTVIGSLYPDGIPGDCFERLSPSNYRLLFADVPMDASYGPHLCAAMVKGLVNGYPDATFKPNKPVNYAEASKILTKAIGLATDTPDPTIEWYTPYVETMKSYNALPSNVNLDDPVTPQAMVIMIAKLRGW